MLENKTGFGISTGERRSHDRPARARHRARPAARALRRDARQAPGKAGVITLMKLRPARDASRRASRRSMSSARWLLIAVLALYALAIWLAPRSPARDPAERRLGFRDRRPVRTARAAASSATTRSTRSPAAGNKKPAHDVCADRAARSSTRSGSRPSHLRPDRRPREPCSPGRRGGRLRLRRHMAPTLNDSQAIAWGALAGLVRPARRLGADARAPDLVGRAPVRRPARRRTGRVPPSDAAASSRRNRPSPTRRARRHRPKRRPRRQG